MTADGMTCQAALLRGQGTGRAEVEVSSGPTVERLVVLHRHELLLLARRLYRSLPADADDLVQSTIIRALERAHQYQPGSDGRSWLVAIECNMFRDRCRRERVIPARAELPPEDLPAPVPEPEPAWADVTVEDVRHALERLDPALREVFRLREFEKLSGAETAARLGIPVNTVGTRLKRSRGQLMELLVAIRGSKVKP